LVAGFDRYYVVRAQFPGIEGDGLKFDLWGLVTLDIQKSKIIVAFGNGIRIICPTDRQSVREPGRSGIRKMFNWN
jgi:hypothetical protein